MNDEGRQTAGEERHQHKWQHENELYIPSLSVFFAAAYHCLALAEWNGIWVRSQYELKKMCSIFGFSGRLANVNDV